MHADYETLAALDAAGAATPDEREKLRVHVQTCDACRRGHDALVRAAALLGHDAETPVATTREQILSAASDPAHHLAEASERGPRGVIWGLAIAAMLFLALWAWREMGIRVAREKVAAQNVELQHLSENVQLLERQQHKMSAAAILAAPGTQTIALAGPPANVVSGRVFFAPDEKHALVFVNGLPSDKRYTFWIVRGDKATAAGALDPVDGAAFRNVDEVADAAAVTAFGITPASDAAAQPATSEYVLFGKR